MLRVNRFGGKKGTTHIIQVGLGLGSNMTIGGGSGIESVDGRSHLHIRTAGVTDVNGALMRHALRL
jgi:hypothetical protein